MNNTFTSLPLKFFYRYDRSLCDIYLKLNNEKFIKIVNSGDLISGDILAKFENKNITSFYVLTSDFELIGMELTPYSSAPEIETHLPDNKELNHLLSSLGISQFTCTEVAKIYEKIVSDVAQNGHVANLLKQVMFNKKRFTYDHSYLTGVIAVELSKKFDWSLTSVKEKLMISAIMHDLKMPEDLAGISDINTLSENVTINVKQAHLKHADLMAKELNDEPTIVNDVVKIVKEHHSLTNPHLSQLTMVFIVAHEFVLRLYNYQLNAMKSPQAFRDVELFFQGSPYEKYVHELASIVKPDHSQ